MSDRHKEEFGRIKGEYEEVVALLKSLAEKGRKTKTGRKNKIVGLPAYDVERIASAVATANDAYALLLMAKAEGFMRDYIISLGIALGAEPKLSTLIDKCRKEFNKTKPKIPIRADDAVAVHDLREQRNAYAHGYGARVFPTVVRVVDILGRFFAQLP